MRRGGIIIASWGVGGVAWFVGRALLALTPMAIEAVREGGLGIFHWIVLVGWVATNAYAEGWLGFHQKFSPRVVDRALYLGRHPSLGRALLAPAFCMGLFHATRRTIITSWTLLVAIVLVVAFVRQIPQPWRGIIDAGVVVGLGIGLVSLCGLFLHAIATRREPTLHEIGPHLGLETKAATER